ncbi:MAG: zinc-ribbon domain-containing protein [Limnochordia bacterium]|nr:zinc-ribbon domain-containing protein [Limnochordia bacterium]
MKTISEKIAYLRGVIDGDPSMGEGRNGFLFGKILQILEELVQEVDELAQAQAELDDYLEEVDFDLAYLEDELFLDEDDHECDCHSHDDWDDDLDDSLVEVECPVCEDVVTFNEEFLFDEGVQIRCPRCDAVVFETADFEELEDLFEEDAVVDEHGEV